MNDTELEGGVAVVAGGSKGTGLATARRLRQMGAQVVTIARTAPEEGDALFVQGDLDAAAGHRPVLPLPDLFAGRRASAWW
ncbi:hypothetical protein ACW69H_25500 [Streptomyces sp. SS10]